MPNPTEEPREKIRYDWARVPCPKCGSQPDQKCRTLTTNRSTDAHDRRIQMGNRWRYEAQMGLHRLDAADLPINRKANQ